MLISGGCRRRPTSNKNRCLVLAKAPGCTLVNRTSSAVIQWGGRMRLSSLPAYIIQIHTEKDTHLTKQSLCLEHQCPKNFGLGLETHTVEVCGLDEWQIVLHEE